MSRDKLSEPVKFLLVGVINTIVGYGVMFGAYNLLHLDYWVSSAANYIIGSICSFLLNKYFTFQARKFSVAELVRFIVCILVCYLVGYGIARPVVRFIFQAASPRVQDNLAMLGGSGVFTVLNFFGQKFFVFRNSGESTQ